MFARRMYSLYRVAHNCPILPLPWKWYELLRFKNRSEFWILAYCLDYILYYFAPSLCVEVCYKHVIYPNEIVVKVLSIFIFSAAHERKANHEFVRKGLHLSFQVLVPMWVFSWIAHPTGERQRKLKSPLLLTLHVWEVPESEPGTEWLP